MNKTLVTPIGEFSSQSETIRGKSIEAYLGIPYARAEAFGLPEPVDSYEEKPANIGCGIRFPQRDVPPADEPFPENADDAPGDPDKRGQDFG